MDLNSKIIKTIPRQMCFDVGAAIGILRNGVLEFDSKDMTSVLMDCCVYDWYEGGKNVVQRYSETHSARPGTNERYLLDAYLQAKYRVLVVQSAVPGAGLHCEDVLNDEELFLMDVGLSRSIKGANAAFASRTIPLGEYSMSSGAGLPINSRKAALDVLSQFENEKHELPASPGSVPLLIVRTCLGTGAADNVAYENIEAKSGRAGHRSRWRWS
jgi:hypothetical protein